LEKLCVIFPSNPLNIHQVDPDYKAEQQEASKYFNTGLVDLDTLIVQSKARFLNLPSGMGQLLYRGWMLRPNQYSILCKGIIGQGGEMITDESSYVSAHLLPNWAGHPNTLKAHWTTDLSDESISELLNQFDGPITVKDFVKSRKNEWDSAFYIPDSNDHEQALKVIHNFIQRQGDLLVGGIVLREFVSFNPIGYFHDEPIYEEYRVYYWKNQPFSIYDYWAKSGNKLSSGDKDFISSQAEGVKSPFFTIDFARLENGKLTIMEIGDGQVSGLQGCPAELFYERLDKVVNC